MAYLNSNKLISKALQEIRKANTPIEMAQMVRQVLQSLSKIYPKSIFVFLWDAQLPFYQDLSVASGITENMLQELMTDIYQANALHKKSVKNLINRYFLKQNVTYNFINVSQENLGVFLQIGEIETHKTQFIQNLITVIELKLEAFILRNELENKPNSIKAQKAHYEIVAEHAGDMILIFDDELIISYASQSVKSLLGYSASYMRRMSLNRLIFPADHKKILTDLRREYNRKNADFNHSIRLLNRDGDFVRFEIHTRKINSKNTDYQYIAICKNVQKHHEAQEKLQKTKANYQLLAENAKDLVCVHNSDGEFIYVSPSVTDLLGYEPEELIGKSYNQLIHYQDSTGLRVGYKKIKKHADKYLARYRFRNKSGAYLWFETLATPVENANGETENLITSSRDITTRIENETKLKENLSFMNKLLEAIPIPVFYKSVNGTYLNCNRRFAQTLGLRKTEIIGKKASDIFTEEQTLKYEKFDEITMKSTDYQKFEMKIEFSNKNIRNILIYKDLYKKPTGETQGIIGAMLDITEQKQAELSLKKYNRNLLLTEEELRQNSEELHTSNEHLTNIKHKLELALKREKETQVQLVHQGKMASIGLLTAGIAHEINNPLTFITGGIETLEQHLNELAPIWEKYTELSPDDNLKLMQNKILEINKLKEEEYYEETLRNIFLMITSIQEGAHRTTEIVRGLKTFSGGKNETYRPADLHEGLDSTLVLLRNKLKKRITIVKDYQTNFPLVECHIGQVNQVFMNLLANATESIESTGTITIKTDFHDNFVRIRITDTGAGMSTETKEKLFEPFYSTKGTKGTGLGLAISYGIIEKHKGDIRVFSEIGKGTEFIIFLPICPKYDLPTNL